MAGRTLTVSSAGKTFSVTGWKIGWAVGPRTLVGATQTAKQFLTFVSGAPFQHAIARPLALPDGYFEPAKLAVNMALRERVQARVRGQLGREAARPAAESAAAGARWRPRLIPAPRTTKKSRPTTPAGRSSAGPARPAARPKLPLPIGGTPPAALLFSRQFSLLAQAYLQEHQERDCAKAEGDQRDGEHFARQPTDQGGANRTGHNERRGRSKCQDARTGRHRPKVSLRLLAERITVARTERVASRDQKKFKQGGRRWGYRRLPKP
jgi:hypothetical protein